MRSTLILLPCALLAVAGCQQEPRPAVGDGSEPADAPATTPSPAPGAPAAPASPRLRAGLWSVTTTTDDIGQTSRMCLDDAVQARMSVMGAQMTGGACRQNEASRHPGGGWAMRTVCDMGPGGRIDSQSLVTGDFRTAYRSESRVTTTGAAVPHMNRTSAQVSEGRYEGACPADMSPGDLEIAGGLKLNMLEMAEQAARMGG